jgi:DNA processing protein
MNEDLTYLLALDHIERSHRQKLTWLRQLAPNWMEFEAAATRIPGQWTKVVYQTMRDLARAEEQHRAHGIQTLVLGSPEYPQRLAEIPDPPNVLYVKGQIREEPRCLAVVGTRSPSPDGLLLAEYWVHELALAQPCIVSGLALGIDAAAHEEAIRSGLTTYAVLAHGLETAHPGRNIRLAERILLEGGAWISEWPYGTPPRPEFFPRRNRIIAGLSDAVLVVEASMKSGASITAKVAHGYNRSVFALPGRLSDVHSQGCLSLVADHIAELALHPTQVLNAMNWDSIPSAQRTHNMGATADALMAELSSPMRVEELQRRTGLGTEEILATLAQLMWSGRVAARSGSYVRKS